MSVFGNATKTPPSLLLTLEATNQYIYPSIRTSIIQAKMKLIVLSAPLFCKADFDTSSGVPVMQTEQDQHQYNTTHACKIRNQQIWFKQKRTRASLCERDISDDHH
jgi:hypothetical protein